MRTSVPSAPKATRILRIDPLHESGQVSLTFNVALYRPLQLLEGKI